MRQHFKPPSAEEISRLRHKNRILTEENQRLKDKVVQCFLEDESYIEPERVITTLTKIDNDVRILSKISDSKSKGLINGIRTYIKQTIDYIKQNTY